MSSSAVSDYTGKPLSEGGHVEAWRDGVRYTAIVKEIRQQEPGSGYRRVVLVRDSDHVEVETFSDATTVLVGRHGRGPERGGDVSDLIAFLNARLDEDEAAARAATSGPWSVGDAKTAECDELAILSGEASVVNSGYEGGGVWDRPDADHIARYNPARILREVEAKRRIVRRCERQAGLAGENCMEEDRTWILWPVLFDLAAVYRDHPDYQQKWAPKDEEA